MFSILIFFFECRTGSEIPMSKRQELLSETRQLYESELEKKEQGEAAKKKEAQEMCMAKEMREASLQTLSQKMKANQGWCTSTFFS